MSEPDRGPLARTLLAMGLFALLVVLLWQLDSHGLLAYAPGEGGLVALVAAVMVVVFAVSVYRGEHHTERKYPLGTGLSRDTPDPSDFEEEGDTDTGDGSRN